MTPEQEQWLIQAIQNHERILENQQSQLNGIQADVSEIKTQIVEIRADVDLIKTEIVEIQADVDGIKTEIVEIRADIDGIKAEIVEIRSDIDEIKLQNAEIREGQAMLMAYLRQQEARRELQKMEYDRDMRQMRQEIAELRQDFLNHMRIYHPPL